MSVNNGWRTKKELSYLGLLSSHKQKQSTDTCFKKDEPWEPAKVKRSQMYGYIHTNCLQWAKPRSKSFMTDMGQRRKGWSVAMVLKLNIL